VTAENGNVKRYYLKPDPFQKSHDAYLSAITWPDIPDFYRGIYGWIGDTIPGFTHNKYDYKVQIPWDVDGIPALVARSRDVNAKVEVLQKVGSLRGDEAARTLKFQVTAEDDTSMNQYTILLEKEKDLSNIQPWQGEPFISELIFWDQWSNGFVEICNPGTIPLDMSNYMFFFWWATTPEGAITGLNNATNADWKQRYVKYIPGYKWQTEEEWMIQPRIAIPDINVNSIVQPGDVFALGDVRASGTSGYPWYASENCDIEFMHNPWGEDPATINETAARQWTGANFYLFKILNDSVKNGLKPATDPSDFQLIDRFGNDAGSSWVIGGVEAQMLSAFIRKPDFYKGKTGSAESFGTDPESSEWIIHDDKYFTTQGVGWPDNMLFATINLGTHFMYNVTEFSSTVGSNQYLISNGYTLEETIKGVSAGSTVDQFLAYIIKAEDAQKLVVTRNDGADTLTATDVLQHNDVLAVTSANGDNETHYFIDMVTVLSNNAVLTSAAYTVNVDGSTGTISGFTYATSLKDIYNGVELPSGATMIIVNSAGQYVPFQNLAFNDTAYNEVMVSRDIYFEVIAEDGVTKITYQLMPDMIENGAFVTSNVFVVDQGASVIDLIPRDITVFGMVKYLIPAPGATVKVVDKLGFERVIGDLAFDDQVVVTSEDGLHTKIYSLQVLPLKASNLAYVTSDVYTIVQSTRKISGEIVDQVTTVEEFVANLYPAPGSTIQVRSKTNALITTGLMAAGYKIWVVSEDTKVTRIYTITFTTAVPSMNAGKLNVYPNPTSDKFFISGLATGNRIMVNNMLGQLVIEKKATRTTEEISLAGQRSGLYLITVTDGKSAIGHYKVILK
jgi:hypothetical protein